MAGPFAWAVKPHDPDIYESYETFRAFSSFASSFFQRFSDQLALAEFLCG